MTKETKKAEPEEKPEPKPKKDTEQPKVSRCHKCWAKPCVCTKKASE